MTSKPLKILCPWLTPKIFPDFSDPEPRIRSFFDHYKGWIDHAETLVLCFAAGNGDHVLNYRGQEGWDEEFEWARYSCYNGSEVHASTHNRNWLERVREGGERSYNPYCAGPAFILSEQKLTYRILARFYECFRAEAGRRGINFKLLEYVEPGPEFCPSEWKTIRHPEAARGKADAGGTDASGVIDVCASLDADPRSYAAYPEGIAAGTNAGDFVAAQSAAFVRDFGLDGVYLGNQFGLVGFWHPDNAPPATPERRAGIKRFFQNFRAALGSKLVYWMDTYWPAAVEIEKWAMSEENYAELDAVMCSNFAVLIERTQIIPNIESKLAIAQNHGNRPDVLFSFDFVDPWYWYRTYLDDRRTFLFQHDTYRSHGAKCQGVSFFANDTFGHWVMEKPLDETLRAVLEAHGATRS